MKRTIAITMLSTAILASCSGEKPLTEAEQAAKYNMTIEQFREKKRAGARMNMGIQKHMKMDEEKAAMKKEENK